MRSRAHGLEPEPRRTLLVEEQAAAVCYRIRNGRIEFLLVRTRKGRWTFPKGRLEPGLTHAETAALEALEEAGVQGHIEESALTQYVLTKGDEQVTVAAHLCEVLELDVPQEPFRSPTWFSDQQAKQRLEQDRAPENATELARVLEYAVARIQQTHAGRLAPEGK